MRPDEHKRHKNTEYKKKHGIKDKKNEKPNQANDKEQSETKVDYKNKGKQTSEDPCDEDASSRTYSKRKLLSNWSRYDEQHSTDTEDEDRPTQRGEDFDKLLAQAGCSESQFRMKDEEDWSDGATDKPHGALGLDLDSLSQSLQCIPLHDRLGIEEKLFSHDQQYELTSAAKHNRTLFEQNHLKQPRNIETIGVKNERKKQSKRETHSVSHKKTSKVSSKKNNCKTGEKVKDGPVDNGSSANQLHNGSNDTSEQTKDVLELEDDLDALLELDDSLSVSVREPFMESYRNNPPPVKPQSTKEEPSSSCAASKAGGDTEKADCAMEKEASKNVCGSNSTGNLEDWLDDMLDD